MITTTTRLRSCLQALRRFFRADVNPAQPLAVQRHNLGADDSIHTCAAHLSQHSIAVAMGKPIMADRTKAATAAPGDLAPRHLPEPDFSNVSPSTAAIISAARKAIHKAPRRRCGERLTTPELARRTGLTVAWIKDHAEGRREPRLPAFKVGKLWVFEQREITTWLDSFPRQA